MLDKKINQVKPEDLVGSLHSSSIINHNPLNPIFTLEDVPYPSVSAYSKEPLMVPEVPYETEEGFRTNVIFPGGMIIENNGEVKIYSGAADTVACLATTQLHDLIDFCLSFK